MKPAFFDDRYLIHGGSINTLSPSLRELKAAGHAGGSSDTVQSTRNKRGAVKVGRMCPAPFWVQRQALWLCSLPARELGRVLLLGPSSEGETWVPKRVKYAQAIHQSSFFLPSYGWTGTKPGSHSSAPCLTQCPSTEVTQHESDSPGHQGVPKATSICLPPRFTHALISFQINLPH